MDIWVSIVVTFVLVLVNGYFSMSEMALVNARHVLLHTLMPTGAIKTPDARCVWPPIQGSSSPPSEE